MAKSDTKPQAAVTNTGVTNSDTALAEAIARAESAEAARDASNIKTEEAVTRAETAEAALAKSKPSTKEKRGEEIAPFMQPDYTGVLTADQAVLRHKAGLCEHSKK